MLPPLRAHAALVALLLARFLAACSVGQFSDGASSSSSNVLAGPAGTRAADSNARAPGISADCPTEDAAPTQLACTGLYQTAKPFVVAPAVRAYAPAHTLWSDGAAKSRYVYLPPGQTIDTSTMDEWSFPVGTKFWKEFSLAGKKLETRFLHKVGASNWQMATYRWNPDETAATRVDGGELVPLEGGDAYEIPSAGQCNQCHSGRIDKVLGFEAVNLGLPEAQGVVLATLVNEGRLSHPPPTTSLTIPNDDTNKAAPALGWLHTNCGLTCHNSSPGAACGYRGLNLRLSFDELHPADGSPARVTNLAAYTTSVNVPSSLPDAGYARITPGSPTMSAIPRLAGARKPAASAQMPPIVSHLVDAAGVAAIDDWIAAMNH
jgi:hypothetical protein